MARSAFILGGTGQIGRAAAARLAERGFDVTLAARSDPGDLEHRFVLVDRGEPGSLEAAVGEPDVLVDVIPFTRADAEQVVALAGRVGSVVAISSAAVYGWENLPVPIPERHPTVEPGDDDYATRKRAVELTLLDSRELRATIVRPGAVHGPYARQAREWYFVKRALDGRRVVVLAHRGASRFHTTSVANLAELIRLAAERPGRRVFNCGDPRPPTALEIGRAVGAAMAHEWTEVLLPGEEQGGVGDHPWNVSHPFVLDMVEAEIELGYRPVTSYPRAVRATVDWLVEATRDRPWEEVLADASRMAPLFDYEAEDAHLRGLL